MSGERVTPDDFGPAFLAMPAVEWIYTQAALSLFGLWKGLPEGSHAAFETGQTTIVGKRNSLVRRFLEGDWPYLLFVDSDMTPPAETFLRLAHRDVPIVGGLCFGRVPPHPPMAGHGGEYLTDLDPDGDDTLREVDWVGFGCVLIERHVVETMEPPWFRSRAADDGGEDAFFCRQARRAGFKVHVDTSFSVGHLGTTSVDADYAETYWRTNDARERGVGLEAR